MFPKGQQKKKDTVVVMVDGKLPQTIPTMDSPPEPQKIPKCRLLVILTILLIFALILLAGYCAWLFFSYETDVLPFKQTHDPDVIIRPTELSGNDKPVTTAPPKSKDDFLSRMSDNHFNTFNSDFVFSDNDEEDSSVESVYDSSEPYGSSESSFSSFLYSDNIDSSDESSESVASLDSTTRKSDKYIWGNMKNRQDRFNRIREFLKRLYQQTGVPLPSYDVLSSYWFPYGTGNELPIDDFDSESTDLESSRLSSDWLEYSSSSGEDPSWIHDETEDSAWLHDEVEDSAWLHDEIDYDSWMDDDYYSSEDGSGMSSSSFYDVMSMLDYIPVPITPAPLIDILPPERMEVKVCSWPSRIFERNNERKEFLQMPSVSERLSCLPFDSFSNTIINENDGSSTRRAIWADFDTSLIALKVERSIGELSTSACFISDLPYGPEYEDNEYYPDEEGSGSYEMEGSGGFEEDESLKETVVIKNPVLLGGDLNRMSDSLSFFCSGAKKFWASSITVKAKPQ